MFNGVLNSLLANSGDDIVKSVAKNYADDIAKSVVNNSADDVMAKLTNKSKLLNNSEVTLNPKKSAKGYVTVYHNTDTPLEEFGKTPIFSKENRNQFFVSNKKDGQISGYGKNTLGLKVKKSDLVLDDAFPSGEKHYTIDTSKVDKYLKDRNKFSYNSNLIDINIPEAAKQYLQPQNNGITNLVEYDAAVENARQLALQNLKDLMF